MKREVTREKVLPAFRIDIAELGLLWQQVLALFEDPSNVHCSLTVELPMETLEFADLEELTQHQELPDTLTKFWLYFHQRNRQVSIRSRGLITSIKPYVKVDGESDAWCAGAAETVYVFFLQHKVSYHWFAVAPIGWLLLLLVYAPGIATYFAVKVANVPTSVKIPMVAVIGWLVLTVTFTLLYLMRPRLFPMAVLLIRQNENFLRRHAPELSLLVSVIALILTIIGWFFAK